MSYYNTTRESGETLKQNVKAAIKQEDAVINLFKANPWWTMPASRIHTSLVDQGWINPETPLTSIRRAIANLAKAGRLKKTDVKTKGKYGHNEYCWELAS